MTKCQEERVRKLLSALQSGDPGAFEQLVDLLGPLLFGFLNRLLGHREDAEDALQETFVSIQSSVQQYSAAGSACGWIFRIAKNHGLQLLRRRKRWMTAVVEETAATSTVTSVSAGHGGHGNDPSHRACHSADLNAALDRLSLDQRLVLLMREMLDLSYAEIAELTDSNSNTVASELHRARKTLQIFLGDNDV